MMKQIKVGFLSSYNYLDRNAWSGTLYSMYQALKFSGFGLVNLGETRKSSCTTKLLGFGQKNKNPLIPGSSDYKKEQKRIADLINQQLIDKHCDVIFAPVASRVISFLDTDIPIIYLSDTTIELYNGYYENFSYDEFQYLSQQELIAISQATRLVYPSHWAACSAIKDYNANPEKVSIIPFGANIEFPPSMMEICSKKNNNSSCHLLFIGKDWTRKGGDIALQTLTTLQTKGINAELTILGSEPPYKIQNGKVQIIPFLDKNRSVQRQKFRELLLQSNYLVFPTRADCSPIVICEANAFGIPVITTKTGGIPSMVKNGKNGYILELSASGKDFANVIAESFREPTKYQQLVLSARQEYDNCLNWNSWSRNMCNLIVNMF